MNTHSSSVPKSQEIYVQMHDLDTIPTTVPKQDIATDAHGAELPPPF